MLRTSLAPYAILPAMLAMCGWLATAHVVLGQSSMGGFGNFGLGTESGFGALAGNSGTSPLQGSSAATGNMGGQSGMSGLGGQGVAMPSLGGGGALGSSFDAGFGATQMASSLATAAAVSRLSGSSMGGRGGFGGGGFGGGRGGFGGGRGGFGGNNMNQNEQNENKVRAVIRIGFPVDRPSGSYTSARVNQRFAAMPLPPSVANVQIVMDGRTAVLQGQVAAMEDVGLIERLLALEPGIDGVRNELTLAGAGIPSMQVPTPVPQP